MKTLTINSLAIAATLIGAEAVFITFVFPDFFEKFQTYQVIIAIFLALIPPIVLIRMNRERLVVPIAFTVAILGYPKSGKTTLLISLFKQIFANKIKKFQVSLRGESTIERVNQQIEKLERGIAVGPTNDQTKFAYQTNIVLGKGLFKTVYKVEFGDFPGEESEGFSDADKSYEILRKSEYFKWAIEADAYLFVIDVGKFMIDRQTYKALMTKTFRASWQHIIDFNSDREKKVRKRPVLLIFNKMDLCKFLSGSHSITVSGSAFPEELPAIDEIDQNNYNALQLDLHKSFEELISFLESSCDNFYILFTSSFGTIQGELADVNKILKTVLPQ